MRVLWLALAMAVACVSLDVGSAGANDVATKLSGGKLKIKGDADDNMLTLDRAGLGADALRVTGATGTTIDGAAGPVIFAPVTSLVVDLGEGSDSVDVASIAVGGDVTFKMGPGRDGLRITASVFANDVVIDGGPDDNAVALCDSAIGSRLTVKSGVAVGGAIAASCGLVEAAGSGSAIVVAGGSTDRLSVKAGKGGAAVRLDNLVVSDRSTIALAGGDDLSICSALLGDVAVKIGKAVAFDRTASCGNLASIAGDNAVVLRNSGLASLSLKTSSADDVVVANLVNVSNGATIQLGAGANALLGLQPTVNGDLLIKSGAGDDMLAVFDGTVQESFVMKAGDGTNGIQISTTGIAGDLLVTTGNGDDFVDVGTATVKGTKTVKTGKGTNTVVP